ncbi:MAG: hypothetical protein ACTSYB_04205 [Candidatus Helarchaeota archaeon]
MKKKIFLIGILAFLVSIAVIPRTFSLDVWGVAKGDTRVYYFTEVYTGNVTGTTLYPTLQYMILYNKDIGTNNRTDVHLRIHQLTSNMPQEQYITHNDNDALYTIAAMFGSENQLFSFEYISLWGDPDNLGEIYEKVGYIGNFILPIKGSGSSPWWGVNWTRAYNQFNTLTSLTEYNATYEGTLMVINCTKYNQVDINGLSYNLTKRIVWDNSTGFLISFEINKYYENGLYQVKSTITSEASYSPPATSTFAIALEDVFWILAVIIGGTAVTISVIVFYKVKKR